MPPVISALLAFVVALCRSRRSMQLEIVALRHQLAVSQRSVPRPRLQPMDRFLWAWLARLWAGWQDTLAFVQRRTVLSWQQSWFREYWRRLSQSAKPGRPAVPKEIQAVIKHMSRGVVNLLPVNMTIR